jgi:hypothetical protein
MKKNGVKAESVLLNLSQVLLAQCLGLHITVQSPLKF